MSDQLASLRDELLRSVSPENPCGDDCRYDERFERVKAEISKLSGVGTGAANWQEITKLSVGLLRESKDLNLASYLTMAWVQDEGATGLVIGLELMSGLMRDFWGQIHPLKSKPRAVCLAWLQEKAGLRLNEMGLKDRDLIERGILACDQLKEIIYEAFEEPPANFRTLRGSFEAWLAAVPAPVAQNPVPSDDEQVKHTVPEPAPPTKISNAQQQVSQQGKPEPSQVSTRGGNGGERTYDAASVGSIFEHLLTVAGDFSKLDPFNEVGCLLRRLGLWHGVGEPRHDDRITSFPDPESFRVDSLKELRKGAQWETLFPRVEDLFVNHWYWWDLQFYGATAAEGMGRVELARIIEQQAMAFDQNVPGLKDLMFTGGTAFASSETKDWLAQLPQKLSTGGGSSRDEAAELLSQLRKLGAGSFGDAMKLAQASLEHAVDGRTKFRMKVKTALFCLESQQLYWAESLARALIEELETNRLAHWEPRLAAEAWSVLLEVARQFRDEEKYQAWEDKAMQQLASLDLAAVARFPKRVED